MTRFTLIDDIQDMLSTANFENIYHDYEYLDNNNYVSYESFDNFTTEKLKDIAFYLFERVKRPEINKNYFGRIN